MRPCEFRDLPSFLCVLIANLLPSTPRRLVDLVCDLGPCCCPSPWTLNISDLVHERQCVVKKSPLHSVFLEERRGK